MAAYIGARLVQLLALLFIISLLTFVLMRGLLGDPVLMILGPDASVDQATVQRLRHELLLDQPIHVQYLEWLRRAAVADFGRSLRQLCAQQQKHHDHPAKEWRHGRTL